MSFSHGRLGSRPWTFLLCCCTILIFSCRGDDDVNQYDEDSQSSFTGEIQSLGNSSYHYKSRTAEENTTKACNGTSATPEKNETQICSEVLATSETNTVQSYRETSTTSEEIIIQTYNETSTGNSSQVSQRQMIPLLSFTNIYSRVDAYNWSSSSPLPAISIGCVMQLYQDDESSDHNTTNQFINCSEHSYLNTNVNVDLFFTSCSDLIAGHFQNSPLSIFSLMDLSASKCGNAVSDYNVLSHSITNENVPYRLWLKSENPIRESHLNNSAEHVCTCAEAVREIHEQLPNHILNISFAGSNKNMSRSIILPTALRSCPENEKDSMSRAAAILYILWMKDKLLPHSCEALLCSASMETLYLNDTNIYVIVTQRLLDLSRLCYRSSKRKSYFSEHLQVFSYDISEIKTKIVFIVKDKITMSVSNFFLIMLHFADNQEFRNCCSIVAGYSWYSFDGNHFYLCNGLLKSCKSTNNLWLTDRVIGNNYIVMSTDDISQSRLMLWLASTGAQFSSSVIDFVLKHEHKEHIIGSSKRDYVFSSKVSTEYMENMKQLTSELMTADILCNETHYFRVCYKQNCLYCDVQDNRGYWMFLYNCSVSDTDDDKIALLLLSSFERLAFSQEYLCQENIWTKSVRMPVHNYAYIYTQRESTDVINLINRLKSQYPQISWVRKDNFYQFADFPKRCSHLKGTTISLGSITRKSNMCNYYAFNTSVLVLEFIQKDLVMFLTFPLLSIQYSVTGISLNTKSLKIYNKLYSVLRGDTLPRNAMLIMDYRKAYKRLRSFVEEKTNNANLRFYGNNKCRQIMNDTEITVKVSSSTFSSVPIQQEVYESCIFNSSRNIQSVLSYTNETMVINFWPCLYNTTISWEGGRTIRVERHYKSDHCKVLEVILFCVSASITLTTIIGNLLVLIILVSSGLVKRKPFMIHTSLAMADLLTGLMPAFTSVYEQFQVISNSLLPHHLDTEGNFAGFHSLIQTPGFEKIRVVRYGYSMVCGIMLNILTNVSLFSLAIFSIERWKIIRGCSLSRYQVASGLCLGWILGTWFPISLNWRKNGFDFYCIFNPTTRITANVYDDHSENSVSSVLYLIQGALEVTAGVLVLIITIATLILYRTKEMQTQEIMNIHHKNRDPNIRHTTRTFLYMVILLLTAFIPLCADWLFDFKRICPTAHFIAWWFLIAGTSGNWIIYCFRGKVFRKQARNILCWMCITVKNARSRLETYDFEMTPR